MSTMQKGSGGLKITPSMQAILSKPGYIKSYEGGQKLRELYQDESMNFNASLLSEFALACYLGNLPAVTKMVEGGSAPDLTGTETPYKFGYVTLTATGSQRVVVGPPGINHPATLTYLVSRGASPNVEDICGLTALHHVAMNRGADEKIVRHLLEYGADPNHRNRYGEVPLLGAFQSNLTTTVDLLLEYKADLNIPEADGITPASFFLRCGPQITATVTKWIRQRNGQDAPMSEKKCGACNALNGDLKQCSKCHSIRYCSTSCQRAHWPSHKLTCQPFSASNIVTVKPYYSDAGHVIPTATFTRQLMGIPTEPTPARHHRYAHAPTSSVAQPKSLTIKVQVPYLFGMPNPAAETGDLLVYTKKRDFVCTIRKEDDPVAYRRISDVVRSHGVGGAKVYFTAELKGKDELVIKVTEVLAEQPF